MLGVSNLFLCVLSVSFTITDGLVGEIPFEELYFYYSVLEHDFKCVTTARLDKTSLSKLTFVSLKEYTNGSMSSLSLMVPDFSSSTFRSQKT